MSWLTKTSRAQQSNVYLSWYRLTRLIKNQQRNPFARAEHPKMLHLHPRTEMAAPSRETLQNAKWPSHVVTYRVMFPIPLQYSASSFLLPASIAFDACYSWWKFLVPCVFRSWFLLINNGSPHHAFSGKWLLNIIQVVCKPVRPLWNHQATKMIASKEQHLVFSAAEVEEKPSWTAKLLPAAAGKHQHEESNSLWRTFLPSLGLVLRLASWSVKTREKVNL